MLQEHCRLKSWFGTRKSGLALYPALALACLGDLEQVISTMHYFLFCKRKAMIQASFVKYFEMRLLEEGDGSCKDLEILKALFLKAIAF